MSYFSPHRTVFNYSMFLALLTTICPLFPVFRFRLSVFRLSVFFCPDSVVIALWSVNPVPDAPLSGGGTIPLTGQSLWPGNSFDRAITLVGQIPLVGQQKGTASGIPGILCRSIPGTAPFRPVSPDSYDCGITHRFFHFSRPVSIAGQAFRPVPIAGQAFHPAPAAGLMLPGRAVRARRSVRSVCHLSLS